MLKNYSNNDKKISMKLKKILKSKYTPVENVDDTNLNTNQTDNQADFLALRIIDNLIRFNQSFRLSQVPIKANMSKYKKGGMIEQEQKEEKELKEKEKSKAKDTKIAQGLLDNIIKDAVKKADKVKKEQKARDTKNALENITKGLDKKGDKLKKEQEEEAKKQQEEEAKKQQEEKAKKQRDEAKKQKDLEELLNQSDGDNKFPSSFESLLSAYSLMENTTQFHFIKEL